MTKTLTYISVILLTILASCKENKFVINGEISKLGTQNIRVVYTSNNTVNSIWVPAVDGKFSIEGNAPDITVVDIFNQQKGHMAHIAVENGDKIELKGDMKDLYGIKITGNKTNEKWSDFINKHKEVFIKGNSSIIDLEIEKFIRENKGSMVSTLLLMNDYTSLENTKHTDSLLSLIDEKAKPESLLVGYKGMINNDMTNVPNKTITSFILYNKTDSLESFIPGLSKVSLLYFWNDENENRGIIMKELKRLSKKYKKSELQITDITLDNDSSVWKKRIKNDSVQWKQFWALGGRMNNVLYRMDVCFAPYFIVTDSVGNPLYRGKSFEEVEKAIEKKSKP